MDDDGDDDVAGNDDNDGDEVLTVSQGGHLLHEAHKCLLEAMGLFIVGKDTVRGTMDSYSFKLAVHALRRGVLSVRVIEMFPSNVFEELARSEFCLLSGRFFWEFIGCENCTGGIALNVDEDLLSTNFETVTTGEKFRMKVIRGLKRHLVGLTLMCYSVLLVYYIVHTDYKAFDFIRALDYCDDVLSVVPRTGTSLFDRELALVHAPHLLRLLKFPESEIQKTVKICEMLYEEEQKREIRDMGRQHYLQSAHSHCKDKVAFGG